MNHECPATSIKSSLNIDATNIIFNPGYYFYVEKNENDTGLGINKKAPFPGPFY